MARGRRPDSSTPDDPVDEPNRIDERSGLVDPLQVASAGLEDVHQEEGASRVSNAFDPEPGTPDPLAVLGRAIDEGLGTHWDEPEPPKRGILGRLGRGREALVPSSSATASAAAAGAPAPDESPVTTTQADVDVTAAPLTAPVPEEPRVTTWAEDFEVASATGEWPAVGADGNPRPVDGESEPATEAGPPHQPRRRGGRRRRRRDEPASVRTRVEPAVDPTGADDRPVQNTEQSPVAPPDDADAERARLAVVREAAQQAEADRLADLREQEALRRAEQAEAQRAEAARAAAEQADAERNEAERIEAEQDEAQRLEQLERAASEADDRWLAAERVEAERIEADRVAAQRAEDERLEALRADAEQAERDRLEGIRRAAEEAERERLEAVRAEESRVELARQEAAEAAQSAAAQAAVREAEAQAAARDAEAQRLEQDRLAAAKAEAARAEPARPAGEVPRKPAVETPARPGVTTPARANEPRATEQVPRFIEFRSTSVLRYLFGAFFVVFAVAAVIVIFRAVSDGDRAMVLGAAGLTALAMLSWWCLLSWAPPVVSISDGVLEIARGTTSASWDLRAPTTEITFRGRRSSRSWRATVRGPGGRPATISARQVDPTQFVEVVEHYQSVGTGTPE